RLRQYAAGRSLWIDEAWLALNVLTHSFRGLAGHLDFEQVAPVPFLWSIRLSHLALGTSEQALRLVPLLAGTLLLLFVWRVAAPILGEAWALLALALAAMNPVLIYYSNELKPYSTDALVCLVVTWLALRVI